MKSMRNVSLKTRTALAVSTLFLVCVGVIAAWAVGLFETEKKASLSAEAQAIVSAMADNIDTRLRLVHGTIIRVAATVPPRALKDADTAQSFLDKQAALHALFDNGLFLVSMDGKLVAESPFIDKPDRRGRDLTAREFVQKTIATRTPYISKPYRSTHNPGQPALIMTAPIFNEAGDMIGLIEGSLDLLGKNILADLATRRLGRTGYLFLADGRETMISHPDQSRIMKPLPKPGANLIFDRALEGFEGAGETVTSRGIPMLAAVKRVKSTGWIIGANLPLAEFYAPIREAQRYFLLSIALGTLAILVLVWLLTHRLISPLVTMTRHVTAMVDEPSAATQLPVTSGDEIGVLAAAFNAMLENLSRLNIELEQRVEQRTAELRASEHLLREAQRTARLGSWILDVQTGAFTWSDETYAIVRRDAATFRPDLRTYYQELVHPDDVQMLQREEQAAYRSGRMQSIDHRIIEPDGEVRWVHLEGIVERDAAGTPVRIRGTLQDITERKTAEQQMIAARDEAERASRAKSEFLSRMSHELRTPMNAILGFSQVLEGESLSVQQMTFVQEIHRAGDHLLDLINDLLDISCIEAGKLLTVVQPVNVQSAVMEAVQITQPLISAKQISFIDRCDAHATVLADHTRLKQILVNLLSNAAKYNRTGGQVLLDCHRQDGDRLRLSVTDTGPGIPPEKQAHLFKPFERLGAEHSAVEGTGIGLALSRQLAELMGGRMGLDSAFGQGSTFWIELPVAPEAGNTDAPALPGIRDVADARPLKVLYVEDNAANLRVVEAMFRHQPHLMLLSATNGEFGLELARRYRPDAILLDIHLPGMDGYAVLDALKGDAATRVIPVIALSADAMPVDIERGLRAGFVQYLTKPVEVEALMEALRSVLKRQPARRQ